jgi:hypothetical protein
MNFQGISKNQGKRVFFPLALIFDILFPSPAGISTK